MITVIEGKCPFCKKETFSVCPTCHHKEPNEKHSQFLIDMDSGNQAYLSTCKECQETITDEQVNELFQATVAWWYKEGFRVPLEEKWKLTKIFKNVG